MGKRQKCRAHLSGVDIIEVILQELDTGVEVGLVELVRHVPAEGPELAPLLHDRV